MQEFYFASGKIRKNGYNSRITSTMSTVIVPSVRQMTIEWLIVIGQFDNRWLTDRHSKTIGRLTDRQSKTKNIYNHRYIFSNNKFDCLCYVCVIHRYETLSDTGNEGGRGPPALPALPCRPGAGYRCKDVVCDRRSTAFARWWRCFIRAIYRAIERTKRCSHRCQHTSRQRRSGLAR